MNVLEMEDLLSCILLQLQPESILVFRSVCKLWFEAFRVEYKKYGTFSNTYIRNYSCSRTYSVLGYPKAVELMFEHNISDEAVFNSCLFRFGYFVDTYQLTLTMIIAIRCKSLRLLKRVVETKLVWHRRPWDELPSNSCRDPRLIEEIVLARCDDITSYIINGTGKYSRTVIMSLCLKAAEHDYPYVLTLAIGWFKRHSQLEYWKGIIVELLQTATMYNSTEFLSTIPELPCTTEDSVSYLPS